MPKKYHLTKKGRLESHIESLKGDLLPPIETLAEAVGLTPAGAHRVLREWANDQRVVARAPKDWVKQSCCPDCTAELGKNETPADYPLSDYEVHRTQFDGILVYAFCPTCETTFVSCNDGDFEETA